MREILFRGKALDTGEWVYGGIVHQTDCYGDSVDRYFIIDGTTTQDYEIGFETEVDPATLGQDTGLLDKNGKKIFDGDIVRTQYGRLCKVGWFSSPGYCGWDLTPTESWNPPPMKSELFTQKNLTVIGNKWDNPELLK